MKDHLTKEQVEKYSQRVLPPIELIEADEHLSRCDLCREHLVKNARAITISLNQEFSVENEEGQHLTFDELADYVDGKGHVDRATIENHLEYCSQCAAEVKDLGSFRSSLPSSGNVRWFRKFPYLALAAVLVLLGLGTAVVYRTQLIGGNGQSQQADSRKDPLESGKKQSIPKESIVAVVQDGPTRITLDKQGNVKGIDLASESEQQILRAALQQNEIPVSNSIQDLVTKTGTVLGDSNSGVPFALTKPVGTVVAEDTPSFQWESLPGAEKYRVAIFSRSMNVVADSGWMEGGSWIIPSPLRRGETYLWQVKAMLNGREVLSPQAPAGEARFAVLDQESFDHVQEVHRKYAGSHLLPALIAAKYGMLDEAESQLKQLLSANPGSKEISLLLQKIQEQRPHKGEGSPVTTKPAQ